MSRLLAAAEDQEKAKAESLGREALHVMKVCKRCSFPCRKRALCWYCHKREEKAKAKKDALTLNLFENNQKITLDKR